ncbi:MAG: diaminopimelate decarboxylase [Candidatus Bipolaricaulota bacterium]|nr:diaminopimelate decarboxylase [Candidatus Bipolaricaulota bacterium]
MPETQPLLEVDDLRTYFFTYQGVVRAVDGISFSLGRSDTVGLVGETGCGKSVATRSILRLVTPPGRIVSGRVVFDGQDILAMSERDVRDKVRGRGIAMVFQKPMSSLNPVFRVGEQFTSVLRLHHHLKRNQAKAVAIESLAAVALPAPEEILRMYPHELSGGMQQRVLIAMALGCRAKLLIADEPTTALDVSVQLQILKLLAEIRQRTAMAILVISHNLGVVSNLCDRVIVMYAGTVVEDGPVLDIVTNPHHPYTQGLIDAVPDFAPRGAALGTLKGEVPSLLLAPEGCRFHPRCLLADDVCQRERPVMTNTSAHRAIACHHPAEAVSSRAARSPLVAAVKIATAASPPRTETDLSLADTVPTPHVTRPLARSAWVGCHGSILSADGIPLPELARAYGTPTYVYSAGQIEKNVLELRRAFSALPLTILYAAKANSNVAVLKSLARMGLGAEVVSGGELFRTRRAGFLPERTAFSGVGKSNGEIEAALRMGVGTIIVESLEELQAVEAAAVREGRRAPVALRFQPSVAPGTHPYLATGAKATKFGLETEAFLAALDHIRRSRGLELVGLHAHVGSQIQSVNPYVETCRALLDLAREARERGHNPRSLDIGGGFAIPYGDGDPPFPLEQLAQAIQRDWPRDLELRLEPGRLIVGDAGLLLVRVLYTKRSGSKDFVIVDAGMNALIRPSLYGASHRVRVVEDRHGRPRIVDVVGPVCENADFLARGCLLPPVQRGDLLAILDTGAYGYVMVSQYNSQPRPAELLVEAGKARLIRSRESYESLVRGETSSPGGTGTSRESSTEGPPTAEPCFGNRVSKRSQERGMQKTDHRKEEFVNRLAVVERLRRDGGLAIIRVDSAADLVRVAEAIRDGGISSIEITMTTPGALEAIRAASEQLDGTLLGAGTILDATTAREAILAGARFLVTPTVELDVIETGHRYDVAVICGAMTPTEILAAWEAGADLVKVFPADALGPGFLKAVRGPLPQIPLVPTGGITAQTAGQYIHAGAALVCAGGWLVDSKTVAEGRYDVLTERARQLAEAVRQAREERENGL